MINEKMFPFKISSLENDVTKTAKEYINTWFELKAMEQRFPERYRKDLDESMPQISRTLAYLIIKNQINGKQAKNITLYLAYKQKDRDYI